MSKLVLTNGTHERITEYVRLIDAEIGMFGYVTLIDGDFYVDDVFLVEQTVTGGSVDFADTGLEYAIQRAIKDDRISDLMFCCHSHVNMGAFWSATDEDMIAGMNNGMTPYLVSLVVNKKGETEQRVDFYNPPGPLGEFTTQVRYDLDLEVEHATDPDVKAEIDALVTRRAYVKTKHVPTKKRASRWSEMDTSAWGFTPALPSTNAAGDITGWRELDELDDRELDAAIREAEELYGEAVVLGWEDDDDLAAIMSDPRSTQTTAPKKQGAKRKGKGKRK